MYYSTVLEVIGLHGSASTAVSAHCFAEFDTSVICHAVPVSCLQVQARF